MTATASSGTNLGSAVMMVRPEPLWGSSSLARSRRYTFSMLGMTSVSMNRYLSNLIAPLGRGGPLPLRHDPYGDGLKKVAGNKLELVLYKFPAAPMKGVLLGTGVTAIIQSSSATSVMVVGFVNSGMMKVRQAIGIVLGAILGHQHHRVDHLPV